MTAQHRDDGRALGLTTDPATGRTTAHLLPRFDTISYRELWRRWARLRRPGGMTATIR